MIGTTLAIQWLVGGIASGLLGGSLADLWEEKCPGKGRIYSLGVGVLGGTLCFLGHGAHRVFVQTTDGSSYSSMLASLVDSPSWHIAMRCLFSVVTSLTAPALDGLTLTYLQEHETLSSADYGQERLFGGISWAIGSLSLGLALDRYGFPAMYLLSTVLAVVFIAALTIYAVLNDGSSIRRSRPGADTEEPVSESSPLVRSKGADDRQEQQQTSDDTSIFELIGLLVASLYGIGFIASFLTLSAGTNIVEGMVFTYFQGVLGTSYTFCGLTVVMTVLWEIPLFAYSPQLLRKYGAGVLQQIAGAAYVSRVVGYSVIPSTHAWYILGLEPLHGVTYACSQTSAVEFAALRMPEGKESAGQGLVMMGRSIGAFFGLLAAGWLQQSVGSRWMYRIFATIVSLGMAFYATTTILDPQPPANRPKENEGDAAEEGLTPHPRASWSRASWSSTSADVVANRNNFLEVH